MAFARDVLVQTALSTAGGSQTAPTLPDQLPPGSKAGPWRVEGELGRGGMGTVYAVVHDEIGKRAALKLMHRRLLQPGVTHADRMLVEARVVNAARHPNIVDIFETGTLPDGRPYIVMERLDGISLATRAEEGKVLTDRAIEILLQAGGALIAAHDVGIVHRDLKLDNIFLVDYREDTAPCVKVLDWGIAKVIASDVHQTVDGQLVGTPQYLAPEQARGAAVSAQTDVYSLGVVAWELFLEQLPFEAETAAEVMAMHLRSAPPVPSDLWPDIPPELEDLLLAMLEKEPAQRPTMRDVVSRLGDLRAELHCRRVIRPSGASTPHERRAAPIEPLSAIPWSDTQLGIVPRRRRWWQYAVGGVALVAAAVMLLVSHVDDSQAAAGATSSSPVAPVATALPVGAPSPQPLPIEAPAPILAASRDLRETPLANPVPQRVHQRRPVSSAPRKKIDPNGTIEPYHR